MSQIRIAKASDLRAFPGSTFVVDDTPPNTQCSETKITTNSASSTAGQPTLTKAAKFAGIDLAGKNVQIFAPPANVGNYLILSNTDDILTLATNVPTTSAGNDIDVTDSGQAYLTRNESSFQRFIESQSKAHTTKGGQLYTDITDPPMDDACSDAWNPD